MKRVHFILFCLIFVVSGFMEGCGKKGDPMPYTQIVVPPIANLKVQQSEDCLELSWSLPAKSEKPVRVRIVRSEIAPKDAACLKCPRQYSIVDDIPADDLTLKVDAYGVFRYRDYAVKHGYLYAYRIEICLAAGNCSEPSNTAELRFEKGF